MRKIGQAFSKVKGHYGVSLNDTKLQLTPSKSMRLKPVELFLALGVAATTVACGPKETPNPAGGVPPQGNITAPAGQPAPDAVDEGGEGGEGGEGDEKKEKEEGGEGGEGN
jgi:hypothetical protein